jgi:hypothetical protein
MKFEVLILLQALIIFILIVIILGQWLLRDECKCKSEKKEAKPIPSNDYMNYERCTCGTTYDFDGIPSRKSCKKHGI